MTQHILLILLLSCFATAEGAKRRSGSISPAEGDALTRILAIENRRTAKDKYLIAALSNPSKRVVKAAMLAIGRIGDASALDELLRFMNRKDAGLKATAAFALSLIPEDTALKILEQHLAMQKDPEVLASIYLAVGRGGNEKSVPILARALTSEHPTRVVEAACQGLGLLWATNSEKWAVPPGLLPQLVKLTKEKEPWALPCAFALARYKGDASILPNLELLEAASKVSSKPARALLVRVLTKVRSPAATAYLVQQATMGETMGIRIEAIKALSTHPLSEPVLEALRKGLTDSMSAVVFQTLETITLHGATAVGFTDAIEALYKNSTSIWLRGAALKTLMAVNPAIAHVRIAEVLKAPASPLLPAAVGALAMSPTLEDLPKLAEYINHPNVKVVEEAIDAISQLPEDRLVEPLKSALKKALERADPAITAMAAPLAEKAKWKDFAPTMAATYPLFTQSDHIEAKIALLTALGTLGDVSLHGPVLQKAMDENEKMVVIAAVDALKMLTGKDESMKIPLNSKVLPSAFLLSEINEAIAATVVLKTTRGDIHFKMLDDAPLNSLNFVQLVRKKFYDGKTFHRVVPNFVVQGGDPRADGYGGPGYLMRDEVSLQSHERGTVGLATAGRDTGGCQFFINLAPNLHLDGRYTVFAEVTKGMDIAEKLEIGDRIISARVR